MSKDTKRIITSLITSIVLGSILMGFNFYPKTTTFIVMAVIATIYFTKLRDLIDDLFFK